MDVVSRLVNYNTLLVWARQQSGRPWHASVVSRDLFVCPFVLYMDPRCPETVITNEKHTYRNKKETTVYHLTPYTFYLEIVRGKKSVSAKKGRRSPGASIDSSICGFFLCDQRMFSCRICEKQSKDFRRPLEGGKTGKIKHSCQTTDCIARYVSFWRRIPMMDT